MWTYKWRYLFPERGEGKILVGPSEVTFGVHGQTVWVDYFETPNVRFMFGQHVVNNSWLKVRMYQKSPLFRIKKVTFIPFVTFRQLLLTTCWRGQHKFGIRGFEVVIWGLLIQRVWPWTYKLLGIYNNRAQNLMKSPDSDSKYMNFRITYLWNHSLKNQRRDGFQKFRIHTSKKTSTFTQHLWVFF